MAIDLDAWLSYKTTRHMRVSIWQVGACYYLLCIIILFLLVGDMWLRGAYSYSHVPLGVVNAWSNGYASGARTNQYEYCSSAAHNYVSDFNFRYVRPACRVFTSKEVVTKGVGSVSFTTFSPPQD